MAQARVKIGVISTETFLQVIIINLENRFTETPEVRVIVGAPEGYDVGAKLYAMVAMDLLEKEKSPTSKGNVYRATDKGKLKLRNGQHNVQAFESFAVNEIPIQQPIPQQQSLDITPIYQSSVGVDTVMSAVDDLVKENASLRAAMISTMQIKLDSLNKLRDLLGYGPLVDSDKIEEEKEK